MSEAKENAGIPVKAQNKPFSREYVMNATLRRIIETVSFSIQKTSERMPEFINEPKSLEVFETLMSLHSVKSQINQLFETINSVDKQDR